MKLSSEQKRTTAIGISVIVTCVGIFITQQILERKHKKRSGTLIKEAKKYFAEKKELQSTPSLWEFMEIPKVKEIVERDFYWEHQAVNTFSVLEIERIKN